MNLWVFATGIEPGHRSQYLIGILAEEPGPRVDKLEFPLDAERRPP